MINRRLIKYVTLANDLKSNNKSVSYLINQIKLEGGTYAITFRVLEILGYDVDEIDNIIEESEVWKGFKRSIEDMFFDYVELDDDLIEPEEN